MQGPDTDAQDHPLHLFTSGLQRTAGPYSWVISAGLTVDLSLPVFPFNRHSQVNRNVSNVPNADMRS